MKITKRATVLVAALAVLLAASAGLIWANTGNDQPRQSATTNQATTQTTDTSTTPKTATAATKDTLTYMIEEEKLAHDVYSVLYDKYGARVFGNILRSESTHQSLLLPHLETCGISDPRSSKVGVFQNTELQALYDKLIAQGNTSLVEAYKVGVAIEERDIADLTERIKTGTDQDVVNTLQILLQGSENHLQAFNRQLT